MARTKVFDEEEVLGQAMDLFWRKGYQATSAQDLVDHLSISRSSLYATYGDKHTLFVRALERYREKSVDPVIARAATVVDIEAYIREFLETVRTDALSEQQARGCFMVNSAVELADTDPEVSTIGNAIMRDTELALTTAIRRGQDTGIFSRRHASEALARYLLNVVNGLRLTVKFDPSENVFDDIVEVSLSVLKA